MAGLRRDATLPQMIASSTRGPWRDCPMPASWNVTSPTATSWPSRPWSGGTGRWSWASAEASSTTPTTPTTPSRPHSSCWRKGRSIRSDGSVGGWLHGVAWRIALQVKSDAARRRDQERRAAKQAGEPITYGPGRDDTLAVIHQEIDRLPDRYRRPVVLCYLEDLTYQQAADQLRWSEATTRGRLARARDLLRARLTRRGVTLVGAGLRLAAGASPSTAATVPAALLRATVRAARTSAWVRPPRRGLVDDDRVDEAGGEAMMIARLKAIAAAALVVATLAGLATGWPRSGPATMARGPRDRAGS